MAAPKTPSSPNTLSIGYSTKLVQIQSISADGTTAMCADRSGYEARVPMFSQRAKGFLPQVNENWIIGKDISQQDGWDFLLFIGSSASSFQAGLADIQPAAVASLQAGAQFGYSGTAALGNLIMSSMPTAGTDQQGNAYLPGYVTYWQSGGLFLARQQQGSSLKFYSAPAAGGPWTVAPDSAHWAADSPSRGTTVAADPQLVVTCLPNVNYTVESVLYMANATTPGLQYRWGIPAGAVGKYGVFQCNLAGTFQIFDSAWTTTNTAGVAGSFDTQIMFKGFLLSTVLGQLQLSWAQSSGSGSTAVLRQGSYVRLTPVN